jgi:hypothetical protein
MNNQDRIQAAYLENYKAAIVALQSVQGAVTDSISPDSEMIEWRHVIFMSRIASDLELITEFLLTE